MISKLRGAFENEFLLLLLFKLIFFVLVDGWSMVAGSLVQSYGG